MILQRFLSSPPPSTGWLLDSTVAATVRRESKDLVRCAAAAMPDGIIEVGPIGLQTIDKAQLRSVLDELQQRTNGGRRVAVVVPTAWLRAHLMSFDHLPRKRAEVDDVVRWRLKKLLPVAPALLRLATVALPPLGGQKRLLCMVGLEKALADLEAVFGELGIRPGAVTPRLFALARGADPRVPHRIVVQQEPGFLSLLLLTNGAPIVLRSKQLPEEAGPWQAVAREQHLTLLYVRGELAVQGPIQVLISAQAPELDHGLQAWWADQEQVSLELAAGQLQVNEPGVAEQLGIPRLAPVYAMLGGGAA